MIDQAYISHETPHRIRFKIPARRHDTAFFQRVEIAFRNSPLAGVSTNPATGSALLHGDRNLIMRLVNERNLFKLTEEATTKGRQFELARLRAEFKKYLGVDAQSAAFLALVTIAAVQALTGKFFPAVAAIWYATDSQRLHQPKAED
jgi:hypothetical protein